jgi:lipoprotein-anchoring transpeptidase ErfK/SrfK
MNRTVSMAFRASLVLALGCSRSDTADRPDTTASPVANPAAGATTSVPAPPTTADMRIEVDVNARTLKVFQGGREVATHSVAVGSAQWPTKTGEWTITQAVWNPDWNPPDESWAEERQPRESGDPKNPMGRAQLVYDPPRSIHGTNVPSSIGKAVSHGSIRLPNEVIVQLARQVMEAAGAGKDEAWYREAQSNVRQKRIVDLPRPVPIRVY